MVDAALSAPPSAAAVSQAAQALLSQLGQPESKAQTEAWDAFQAGDFARVRTLGATNLEDCYIKALGYLCSTQKQPAPPTINVILAEAARAISDHSRAKTLRSLSAILDEVLSTD